MIEPNTPSLDAARQTAAAHELSNVTFINRALGGPGDALLAAAARSTLLIGLHVCGGH